MSDYRTEVIRSLELMVSTLHIAESMAETLTNRLKFSRLNRHQGQQRMARFNAILAVGRELVAEAAEIVGHCQERDDWASHERARVLSAHQALGKVSQELTAILYQPLVA